MSSYPQPKPAIDEWQPILTGEAAAAARAATEAILADLRNRSPADRQGSVPDPFAALPFAHAAASSGRQDDADQARHRLAEAITFLGSASMAPGLLSGFCGVAWLAEHLTTIIPDPTAVGGNDDDACAEIDEALIEMLSRERWSGSYDLVSGLVGLGIYALERQDRSTGRQLLALVCEQLAATAIRQEDGVTWLTPVWQLPDYQRVLSPEGHYNLGVAHGVPGFIAFAGHVIVSGLAPPDLPPLLEGAIRWVLARQLDGGPGASFPCWVGPGHPQGPARMAWCYGGLGLSAALMIGASALNHRAWSTQAQEFALAEAARPFELTGVHDTCLCHGTAGNAHMFARFFHATRDERFLTAALEWYDRTLTSRRPHHDIGGYRFFEPPGPNAAEAKWVTDSSFASGASGVAMALQTAVGGRTPTWDRLLLIDIPAATR